MSSINGWSLLQRLVWLTRFIRLQRRLLMAKVERKYLTAALPGLRRLRTCPLFVVRSLYFARLLLIPQHDKNANILPHRFPSGEVVFLSSPAADLAASTSSLLMTAAFDICYPFVIDDHHIQKNPSLWLLVLPDSPGPHFHQICTQRGSRWDARLFSLIRG